MLLRLLLALLLVRSSSPLNLSLCRAGHLVIDGNDYLRPNGVITLAFFMPSQCSTCEMIYRRLSTLVSTHTDARFIVITPSHEPSENVNYLERLYPKLSFVRDSAGIWTHYAAVNHDVIIFDRCGRITNALQYPHSDVTTHRYVEEAISTALQYANCGWCHYETRGPRQTNQKATFNFKAYVKEGKNKNRNNDQYQNSPQQSYASPAHGNNYGYSNQAGSRQDPRTSQQNNGYRNPAQQRQANDYQQQIQQYYQQQSMQRQQQQYFTTAAPYIPPPPPPPTTTTTTTSTSVSPTPTIPIFTLSGDDDDYESWGDMRVTRAPIQTQIPRPPEWNPSWPTPAPQNSPASIFLQKQITGGTELPSHLPQISENNLPCTAYTDEICFQQYEKLGESGLSKCCRKGVYLTDVCETGKCSNSTFQLCCLQKFLQARYQCCEDPAQDNVGINSNSFNKCCYSHFATEDNCCPLSVASTYWTSSHELCFPNTFVNLTDIRLEARVGERTYVVDLGKNQLWAHECRHGAMRSQLAFLPPTTAATNGNN